VATSALGLLWVAAWLLTGFHPERHPRVSREELEYIRSGRPESAQPIPWLKLLGRREMWGFVVAKTFTDPVWWFYLFWLPGFLHARYGVELATPCSPSWRSTSRRTWAR
jgi:ACS family hexuronate transporter-like MFS transporter